MTTTITAFTTLPPNNFDLHYWLFGILVMLSVTALLDGYLVSRTNIAIGSDTFIFTSLIGLFVGSLIGLIINILPFYITIVMFALVVIYVWRGRG